MVSGARASTPAHSQGAAVLDVWLFKCVNASLKSSVRQPRWVCLIGLASVALISCAFSLPTLLPEGYAADGSPTACHVFWPSPGQHILWKGALLAVNLAWLSTH